MSIVISEQARIPPWVMDHESYRRWMHSSEFPERGQFFHLNGELWVDLGRETLDHNQIKYAINLVLGRLILEGKLGRFCPENMMLTNLDGRLSTEPDGMFIATTTLHTGRVVLEQGDQSLEVFGTPDMVLEVVSKTSVRKDTVVLPELYYRAGITEYWVVDARPGRFRFDIFRRGRRGYVATRRSDGWIKSEVFGKAFKLTSEKGADGTTDYRLDVR